MDIINIAVNCITKVLFAKKPEAAKKESGVSTSNSLSSKKKSVKPNVVPETITEENTGQSVKVMDKQVTVEQKVTSPSSINSEEQEHTDYTAENSRLKKKLENLHLLHDVLKLYVTKEFKRKNELVSINGNESKLEKIIAELEDEDKKGGNIQLRSIETSQNGREKELLGMSDHIERQETPQNPEVTTTVDESEQLILEAAGLHAVEVRGIGHVAALIDSGSNTCVIRRNVLTDSIISKIIRKTSTAILSDGSQMDIVGYVNLYVSYLGKSVKMKFCIVNDFRVPLVLGATWIRRSCAILHSDGVKIGVTFDGMEENKLTKWFTKTCPPPLVSVDLDGIGVVSAMVDTGTLFSVIRKDQLTELQLSNAIRKTISKDNADKPVIKRHGLGLIDLKVPYQGMTTCIENVEVESSLCDPFILGLDWIHKSRVIIQSDGSKIIVQQPGSQPKKKNSEPIINRLSKHWKSSLDFILRRKMSTRQEPK